MGTLAHAAFELIFDHPRGERTPEIAVTYVRPHWEQIKDDPNYDNVRHLGDELVERAEDMVRRWFSMENPNKFEPAGRELTLTMDVDGIPLLGIIDRVDSITVGDEERVYISDYKGLALDTLLPTPTGWTTMGDVAVGDELLGADGSPTRVTVKSEIHSRPCYQVTFTDGSIIVADNVHLWAVSNDGVYEVVDTEELARRRAAGHRLLTPKRRALELSPTGTDIQRVVAWVLQGCNPKAPEAHAAAVALRSAIHERIHLLGAINDELGRWEDVEGVRVCVLDGMNEAQHRYVAELLATMSYPATSNVAGEHFELEYLPEAVAWEIETVSPVESVPTQCVQVDSPAALYLAGAAMIPTHNTGKVPAENDRFLDEKFFAMRAYAMLWHENHGTIPYELRLLYVAGGSRDAVRRKSVDSKMIKATKNQMKAMVGEIKQSAKAGQWECRKHVLCQWCDFIDVCPLYHPELAGIPVGEIKKRFSGELAD
jgi:RecB family exonuclease